MIKPANIHCYELGDLETIAQSIEGLYQQLEFSEVNLSIPPVRKLTKKD